jgi:ketosteroid isomerase-like protein
MDTADRIAIGELMSRSAYALDERDLARLEACFAEDAVMSLRIAGGDLVGPFEGREAIMGLMKGSMDEQTDQRRHVISNLFVDPDGDGARVTSNLTLLATEDDAIRLLSAGIYHDEVRRVGDRWVLSRRHIDLDLPY